MYEYITLLKIQTLRLTVVFCKISCVFLQQVQVSPFVSKNWGFEFGIHWKELYRSWFLMKSALWLSKAKSNTCPSFKWTVECTLRSMTEMAKCYEFIRFHYFVTQCLISGFQTPSYLLCIQNHFSMQHSYYHVLRLPCFALLNINWLLRIVYLRIVLSELLIRNKKFKSGSHKVNVIL